MSLRAIIAAAVKTAFDAADDVPRPMTFHAFTGNVRDIVAGTNTRGSTSYTLEKVLGSKFEVTTTDKTVELKTDQKLLFPAADLPIVPKAGDWLVDENNATWEVQKLMTDPAFALRILHVRSTK
jgi:hypothetical protein